MKKLTVAVCAVVLSVLAVMALSQEKPAVPTASTGQILPTSLDSYYPPKTPAPMYLIEMHRLAQPLSGLVCDATEGDFANVQKNFDAFRAAYSQVAALVPEWADRYPMPPVDALGEAVASGDPGRIMGTLPQIGQVCHSCHVSTMAQVQHRYSWPEFGSIKVTDPLTNTEVNFAQIMQMMESNMTGVANDLAQGQIENARNQLNGFKARFGAMAATCDGCHDSERKYYTSDDITATIDELAEVLAQKAIDDARAVKLLQTIGQESCRKCHLVHIPAAYAQVRQAAI